MNKYILSEYQYRLLRESEVDLLCEVVDLTHPSGTIVKELNINKVLYARLMGGVVGMRSDPQNVPFLSPQMIEKVTGFNPRSIKAKKGPVSSNVDGFLDENDNMWNLDVLRDEITQPPSSFITSGNEKMAKLNTVSISLPAITGLFYDERDGLFKVATTCGRAGICKNFCYATKGNYVMVPAASIHYIRILNYILNHWDEWQNVLVRELNKAVQDNAKSGLQTIMRWHTSGDFLSEKYFSAVMDIARKTPKIQHYAYTKFVSMVKGADKPANFEFTFSFGGVEDKFIDKDKDKYSSVETSDLYKDFMFTVAKSVLKKDGTPKLKDGKPVSEVTYHIKAESVQDLKDVLAAKEGLNASDILTVGELTAMPLGSTRRWYVVVLPKESDLAAVRTDVRGVYLIRH